VTVGQRPREDLALGGRGFAADPVSISNSLAHSDRPTGVDLRSAGQLLDEVHGLAVAVLERQPFATQFESRPLRDFAGIQRPTGVEKSAGGLIQRRELDKFVVGQPRPIDVREGTQQVD
jgi:hypothetical protein